MRMDWLNAEWTFTFATSSLVISRNVEDISWNCGVAGTVEVARERKRRSGRSDPTRQSFLGSKITSASSIPNHHTCNAIDNIYNLVPSLAPTERQNSKVGRFSVHKSEYIQKNISQIRGQCDHQSIQTHWRRGGFPPGSVTTSVEKEERNRDTLTSTSQTGGVMILSKTSCAIRSPTATAKAMSEL